MVAIKRYVYVLFVFLLVCICQISNAAVVTLDHTWNGTEVSTNTRLFKDGVTSFATNPPKVFPGTISNAPTYFFAFEIDNIVPNSVVTIDLALSDFFSFISAYSTAFDPISLDTNYLGDIGFGVELSYPGFPFSVLAPSSGKVIVVTNSVDGIGAIGHRIVANISYTAAVSAVPEPETYGLMALGLGLIGTVVRRRKRA